VHSSRSDRVDPALGMRRARRPRWTDPPRELSAHGGRHREPQRTWWITVPFDDDLWDRLEREAREAGQTIEEYLEAAVAAAMRTRAQPGR
jgi:hypothetical protein